MFPAQHSTSRSLQVTHLARAAHLQGLQLVLYGDSIMESWLEKDVGAPCPAGRCAGLKAVFDAYFGHWTSTVLALGSEVCALLPCTADGAWLFQGCSL